MNTVTNLVTIKIPERYPKDTRSPTEPGVFLAVKNKKLSGVWLKFTQWQMEKGRRQGTESKVKLTDRRNAVN